MKKILFLFIVLHFIAGNIMAQYSGGNGSESTPFLISEKGDMETLAAATRAGNDYSGKYFRLTKDLTEVSTFTGTFRGVFDGNGHVINLKLESTSSTDSVGVFGVVKKAVIKNLGVSGIVSSGNISGGICGYADSSAISNCYNAGNITGSRYAGGICGYMNSTTISNSYNTGYIVSQSASGGICGYVRSSSAVSECYNTGNITSSTSSGGICGYTFQRDSIRNCFAANTLLEGDLDIEYPMAQRIVGYNGSVENCYALSSMAVNGQPRPSSDSASNDGKDAELTNFQNSSWIVSNLHWNFTNVWAMPKNQGFPVLQIFIPPPTVITISLTISKEYDGTNVAVISNSQLIGVNSGDNVTANMTGVTATFNDKNAGTNKPVSLNETITLSGTDAEKYILTPPTGVTGSITQKNITVTANPKSKNEGEADPPLTYTQTPNLIAGDTFSGNLVRDPGEEPGTYHILQGNLSPGSNYHVTYQGAWFTIIGKEEPPQPGTLIINGESVGIAHGGRHFRYSLTCGSGETSMQVIPPATIKGYPPTDEVRRFDANEGRNRFFIIPEEGVAESSEDTLTIINPPSMLIVTLWDDVLSVINNPNNNGGFEFTSYQWQKNGEDMPGEIEGNLYFDNDSIDFTGEYTVRLTTTEGEEFESCPLWLVGRTAAMSLKVYPNPVAGTATVESSSVKPGDKMEIYNINGDLVQKLAATGHRTEINLSALPSGSYVLKVNNERIKLFKQNK